MSLSFAAWSDDSYFSIARDFLANTISVETLERALFLGGLGYQVVLKTTQVFGLCQVRAAQLPRANGGIPCAWHAMHGRESDTAPLPPNPLRRGLRERIFST